MFKALLDPLFVILLYILPQHLLSRGVYGLTRIKTPFFKNGLIRFFIHQFKVDMSIALEPDPTFYDNFNHFFTRGLKPDARPVASGLNELASPVDGVISQLGDIHEGRIFQAKGHDYSLASLLGSTDTLSSQFINGSFATIYLSPKDYHRIHMPIAGTLLEMHHIPGRLYSVNDSSTRLMPGLFARNERVVALFDTAAGPMAMILVGALFVGSIETVWAGTITNQDAGNVHHWDYRDQAPITLEHGEEMGRFNMGSTVILLFGEQQAKFAAELKANSPLQTGQHLGHHQAD